MASGGWNTIESDAGVFTFLLDNLGVRGVQFEELISLDSESISTLSPVYGVIFLFKYPTTESRNKDGTPHDGKYDYAATELTGEAGGEEEPVWFAAQTIQNACGTQALLSVLMNKSSTEAATKANIGTSGTGSESDLEMIDIGEKLREFKEFTKGFPAEFTGEALSNSELIRDVHNSFAKSSPFVDETQRTATEDDDVYHFIAYTPINGTLYELDGLQPAPISHGPCAFSEFPSAVIPVLQRRIGRYPATEIRFNLLAMVRDLRIGAREAGDFETLQREEKKRSDWIFENSLRRHNFVGFAGEVLKSVVRRKLEEEGQFEEWVKGAEKATQKRLEEGRKGAKGGDEDEEMVM